MLEKLAELVREDALEYDDMNDLTLRCMECDFKPILGKNCKNMQGKDCPLLFNREEKEDFVDGSLMLARWAVLLVAKGLEKLPDAKAEDLKGLVGEDGKPRAKYLCAMSNLGINLMKLLCEAVISARAEAKEGTNG